MILIALLFSQMLTLSQFFKQRKKSERVMFGGQKMEKSIKKMEKSDGNVKDVLTYILLLLLLILQLTMQLII